MWFTWAHSYVPLDAVMSRAGVALIVPDIVKYCELYPNDIVELFQM